MRKHKNLVALVLACAMLLSFAAVAGAEEGSYYNTEGYPICNEVVDVTMSGPLPSGLEDWTKVVLIENFKNDLGINITCQFYNSEDWSTQLTLMIASDELTDMVGGANMNMLDANEWGSEGYLVNFNEYRDITPNMNKYLEQYPAAEAYMTAPDGGIYTIPKISLDETDRFSRTFINKKWLANVGMEVPKTMDELYEVLKAFKEQDANGNGDPNDEIPFLYASGYEAVERVLMSAYGIHTSEINYILQADADGKVYLANTTDAYKEYMKWMARAFSEGLIEQEAFVIEGTTINDRASKDLYGFYGCGSAPYVVAVTDISYDAENLLNAMEKELLRRRFGPPIRLEITDTTSPFLSQLLADQLGVNPEEVYRLPAPLDFTVLFELQSLDRPDLKNRPFIPTTNRQIAEVESSRAQDIFAAIRERDILLHHPYDSFSTSVQAFLAQAAADPRVLAIKQTLYRTSSNSPIIDALIDAAHAGKQVLALVEIKARFDEDANIAWARKLERAGVHVVYGIVGLKTHCKLIEVVRQEQDGLKRYCHVGTGNYNPKTARLYTDLGLLTCDPVVGQDLTRLFNQLSGYAPKSSFHRLLVAPRTVRTGLIQRIRREEDAAKAGKEAWIKIKVNSLVDEKTIDALYRASQAGVKIDIVERGICALKPGVPGMSDNIRVRSILGRFLEHSRIYAFCNSDGPQIGEGPISGPEVWIGSADLMHRNLDRRVEALVRVTAPEQIDELIRYVDLQMSDSTASWHMQPDGTYIHHSRDDEGRPLVDSQEYLIRKHQRRPRTNN